jgi:hypothetical protein
LRSAADESATRCERAAASSCADREKAARAARSTSASSACTASARPRA